MSLLFEGCTAAMSSHGKLATLLLHTGGALLSTVDLSAASAFWHLAAYTEPVACHYS